MLARAPIAPVDDNRLVAATLDGDLDAFGELVERYQKPLYNAAFRITGNREDALEATQTAFVKVYDKLARFDPSHRFFSWIFRVVVNESVDIVNHRRRWVEADGEEPERRTETDPETELSSLEEGARVRRALAQLDPEYRTVIVLRHFQELSYSEMAEVIGIPEKTVKSRLFTARRELRLRLSAQRSS